MNSTKNILLAFRGRFLKSAIASYKLQETPPALPLCPCASVRASLPAWLEDFPANPSVQKRKKVTGGVSLPVTRRPGAGIMVSSDFRRAGVGVAAAFRRKADVPYT